MSGQGKGKPKSRIETTTASMPRGMIDAVKEFLETDQAKKMGYVRINDIIAEALRQFLTRRGFYEERMEAKKDE